LPQFASTEDIKIAIDYLHLGDASSLYKAYERIKIEVPITEKQMIEKGWCTKKQMRRFCRSMQSKDVVGGQARHDAVKPPKVPMHLVEATSSIHSLISNWINILD